MRLSVHPGGLVVLTVPFGSEQNTIREFLARQTVWLKRAVARMMKYRSLPVSGRRDYLKYKEQARAFVHERVAYWNTFYNVRVRRIAIKNTRRTWGSCSRR